ncbi:MAG: AAA family ATPase [Candidatus Hydrogenedentes bacterium]|nr:AAA family ATPase [Candidatus Hydrogenedentota bacterium]
MDDAPAYVRFFGLSADPFAPTSDPAYFYATRAHRECLGQLWESIDTRRGLAVALGNHGCGKTMLLRKLLTDMIGAPERYVAAVLGAPLPSWSSQTLLEATVAQFGLQPAAPTFLDCMEALQAFLVEQREKVCTLIIDDAQHLNKRGQLELLRLLQELETQQHKLLNLVLFAQMEWIDVLRAAPNFEQRINLTTLIGALAPEELHEFVQFRLEQAGGIPGRAPEFSGPALRAVWAYAEGNTRLIVTLCRNALHFAARAQLREIGHELVVQTIERTTVPDAEKRARVAAAVMEALHQDQIKAPADVTSAAPLLRDRQAREQRAAELLLRGAGKPAGGG